MRLLIATVALLFMGSAFAATISVEKTDIGNGSGQPILDISLEGPISPGDTFNFDTQPGRAITVMLDSPGGDVLTAMRLGRELREADQWVGIKRGAQCVSSCVFLLAGAVHRTIFGVVGIHRPYPTRNLESREDAQRVFENIRAQAESYLREMNMPSALFDAMVRVPSKNIHYLSRTELNAYGLSRIDPAYEYYLDGLTAQRHKISRSELLRRERTSDRLCGELEYKSYRSCNAAVMWSLPTPVAQQRLALIEDVCEEVQADGIASYRDCEDSILGEGEVPQ